MSSPFGCVLLAAGLGRRFGGNKLLFPVEGTPMVERAFSALPPALFARRCVVSGYEEILSAARRAGYAPVFNARAEEGQSVSVRLGAAAMAGLPGAVFAVCDQPWLTRESVERLLSAARREPGCIHALAWGEERGSPVYFPAALFPALLELRGDKGGGAVIARHPHLLRLTQVTHPRELEDLDRRPEA